MILYFVRRLKLMKLVRELRTAIAVEAIEFSGDIKDQYHDNLNRATLTLGALNTRGLTASPLSQVATINGWFKGPLPLSQPQSQCGRSSLPLAAMSRHHIKLLGSPPEVIN